MSPPSSSRPSDPHAEKTYAPAASPAHGGPTDPSHDQNLRRGILHTDVSRPVAAMLAGLFLVTIYAVPITQTVLDKVNDEESVWPDLFARWPTQESIHQFETDLEDASTPREAVRPRLQSVLTRFGGFGNTKAVIGRDGWLFYQPGVAAVGGPGLLDPALLASRAKAALDSGEDAVYPDPRPAILAFRDYLAQRGIPLVIFPVPDKAGLQPAQLHGRMGGAHAGEPGRNVDSDRLLAELRASSVLVFDPTPSRLAEGEPPRFLRQDTHWTPTWMEATADALGRFVTAHVTLPAPAVNRQWTVTARSVSRVGDIVDMLRLPDGQTMFAPQTVTVQQVHDGAGALFESKDDADVLLLGDSFCNIFTLAQMGWGEAAGLAPQLARALGRDIDVIAQNDAGAFATRRLLLNELANPDGPGHDRLTGKRVVIWEFASRELAVGDWKPLTWPTPAALPAPSAPPASPDDTEPNP